MDPVNSNRADQTCGDPISSNCVTWAGAPVNGLCGKPTLTQVVQNIYNSVSSTNNTVSPCYIGNWINFSTSIPLSGSDTGYTWTINSMGKDFRGLYGLPASTGYEDLPQYKWTKDGDLKIRGTFALHISPTGATSTAGFFTIPLCTIPVSCFPSTWKASQSAIIGVDIYPGANLLAGAAPRSFLTIDYPSGTLYLNGSFALATSTFIHGIFMGGTSFNIA